MQRCSDTCPFTYRFLLWRIGNSTLPPPTAATSFSIISFADISTKQSTSTLLYKGTKWKWDVSIKKWHPHKRFNFDRSKAQQLVAPTNRFYIISELSYVLFFLNFAAWRILYRTATYGFEMAVAGFVEDIDGVRWNALFDGSRILPISKSVLDMWNLTRVRVTVYVEGKHATKGKATVYTCFSAFHLGVSRCNLPSIIQVFHAT